MGNLQNSVFGHFYQVNTHESPVFVIPRYINFTPSQMSTMIAMGQQPGVPFRVGGEGAQRPPRPTKKAQITDNLGSLFKNSFAMTIDEDGVFAISFMYDAMVPLSLNIFFGAKDSRSSKEIRPKRVSHQWGPFDLAPGHNVAWSSSNEFVHGDIQNLTCSYDMDKQSGHGLHYDFIVVLDSSRNVKKSEHSAAVLQASYFSVNPSCFKTESTQTKYRESPKLPSAGDASKREQQWDSQQQRPLVPESPMSMRIHQHYWQLNQAHELWGVTGKIAVTCRQQKIQMNSGDVYVVQDLYGMSTGPSADESIRASAEEGAVAAPTTPPPDQALDTDTPECVICLTDEKEVVVYPCRHMCMCITCAEALPSQGNKCPMCRRPASMLLRLAPKH